MRSSYALCMLRTVYAQAFCTQWEWEEEWATFVPLVDLAKSGPVNCWLLNRLWVRGPYRGRHYGSILIERICRQADSEGVTLILAVDPDWDSPLQDTALLAFYRRHGFVLPSMDQYGYLMIRSPRGNFKSEAPNPSPASTMLDRSTASRKSA